MGAGSIRPAAASEIRICCDGLGKQDWSGRLYTRYHKTPSGFGTVNELISQLEYFCDWLNYPQASMKSRSFQQIRRNAAHGQSQWETHQPDKEGERIAVVSREEMNEKHGERATFVVRIQYRQNATWQGQVTWAEKQQTMQFRSALELLKLIDSTVGAPDWEAQDKIEEG